MKRMNAIGIGLIALMLCMLIVAGSSAEGHAVDVAGRGTVDRDITFLNYDWTDGAGTTNNTMTLPALTHVVTFTLDAGLYQLNDWEMSETTIVYVDGIQAYWLNDYSTLSVYVEDDNGYPVEDQVVSSEAINCTYRGITGEDGIAEILVEDGRFYTITGEGISDTAVYVDGNTSVDVVGESESESPYLFDMDGNYLGGSLLFTLALAIAFAVAIIFLLGMSPLVGGVLGITIIGALFLGMLILPSALILVVLIFAGILVMYFMTAYVGKPLAKGLGRGAGRKRY